MPSESVSEGYGKAEVAAPVKLHVFLRPFLAPPPPPPPKIPALMAESGRIGRWSVSSCWLLLVIITCALTSQLARAETTVSIREVIRQLEFVEGQMISFDVDAVDPFGGDIDAEVEILIEDPGGYVAEDRVTVKMSKRGARGIRNTLRKAVRIPTLNDALDRPNGLVTVRLRGGSGYRIPQGSVERRERTFTIRDDDELPGSPTNVRARPAVGTMTISWDAPADPGKVNGETATVTGYELRWAGIGGNIAAATWVRAAVGSTSHVIRGLTAHQHHFFQVRAVTAAGAGATNFASAVQINSAPSVTLNSIAATINSSEALNLQANGTDPDVSDTLRYVWTVAPRQQTLGTLSNSRSATPTWTAPWVRLPLEVTFQVQVSDGSQQVSASQKITVQPAKMELTTVSQSVSEGGSGVHQISLSVSNSTARAVAFPITVRTNVSAPNVELVNPPASVTIPIGQSSASFSVQYRGNLMDNPDRQVTVTLLPNDWYTPAQGKSTATITITDDDDPPTSAPSGLTASAGYRQVTLSWTAPTQTGLLNGAAAPITGYEYRVAATTTALADATWIAIPDSAAATSHIVPNLALETDYAFDVRVRTAVGAGPASSAATATTRGLPKISVTSATDSTTLTEGGAIEFNLNVTTGALDRNGHLRTYFQVVDVDGRLSSSTPPTEITIPGETSSYSFRLATKTNNLVDGDSSITITMRSGAGYTVDTNAPSVQFTIEDDDDYPGAPTALTSQAGYRQVDLSWTPPTDTGRLDGTVATLTGYEYRVATDESGLGLASWTSIANSASATSHRITGLDMNQAYSIQLRARNSPGAGAASAVHSVTTLTGLTVSLTADAPTSAVEGTTFNARLRANPGAPDADLGVNIELVDAGGRTLETGPLTATITGGSREVVRVIRSNNDGIVNTEDGVTLRLLPGTGYAIDTANSEVEFTVTDNETAPGAPQGLTATPGYRRIHLAWSAPTNAGTLNGVATPVTGYEYRIAPSGESIADAAWRTVAGGAATTSEAIVNLEQTTAYAVEVRARNAAAPSPAATVSTTTETLVVSIKQTGATTVTEGQGSLPATDRNRPVYFVEVSPLPIEENLTVNLLIIDPDGLVTGRIRSPVTLVAGQDSTSKSWEFLTNQNQKINTAEKVRLTLLNGDGYQPDRQAAVVEFTVNDDDATPSQVLNLAVAKTIDTLTYTWAPPSSSGQQDGQAVPVLRYEVRHTANGGALASQTYVAVDGGAGARSFKLTGLADNQAVDLEIRAVNRFGPGHPLSINANSVLNTAPTVSFFPRDVGVLAGEAYLVFVSGKDADAGDTFTYGLTGEGTFARQETPEHLKPPGNPNGLALWAWSPPVVNEDTDIVLTATIRDARGLTASATQTIRVLVPIISIRAVPPQGAEGGATDTGTASFELSVSSSARAEGSAEKTVTVGMAAIPQNDLAVTDRSARTVDVGFAAVGDKETVTYSFTGNDTDNPDLPLTATLLPGTGYVLKEGEATATYTVQDDEAAPSAPQDPQATGYHRWVTLSWSAPADPGERNGAPLPVTGYEYRFVSTTADSLPSGESLNVWKTVPGGGTATSHDLADLENGKIYEFEVRAQNVVGAGPATNRIEATPANSVPTITLSGPTTVSTGGTVELVATLTDHDPRHTPIASWSTGFISPLSQKVRNSFTLEGQGRGNHFGTISGQVISWTAPVLSEDVTYSITVRTYEAGNVPERYNEATHTITVKVPEVSLIFLGFDENSRVPGRPLATYENPPSTDGLLTYQNAGTVGVVLTTGEGATAADPAGRRGVVPAIDTVVHFEFDDPDGWLNGRRVLENKAEILKKPGRPSHVISFYENEYEGKPFSNVTESMDILAGETRSGFKDGLPFTDFRKNQARTYGFVMRGDIWYNRDAVVGVSLKPGPGYKVNEQQKSFRFTVVNDDWPPTTPTDLVVSYGRSRADVSWGPVSFPGRIDGYERTVAFRYETRYAPASADIDDVAWTNTCGDDFRTGNQGTTACGSEKHRTQALENLEEGKQYRFQVRAAHVADVSAPAEVLFTVARPEIRVTTVVDGTSSASAAEGSASTAPEITFKVEVIAPEDYASRMPQQNLTVKLTVRNGSTSPPRVFTIPLRILAGAVETGLDVKVIGNDADNPDYEYTATLQADDAYRFTAENSRAVFTVRDDDDPPGAPALTAAVGGGSVTLSWTPPVDPGQLNGSPASITGYEVRWAAAGTRVDTVSWTTVTGGADVREYIATGLTNGIGHHFQVRAVNVVGVGAPGQALATPTNTVPQVEAGEDAIVTSGGALTLAGEASDPDVSDTLTLAWSAGQGSFSDATLANAVWTAPEVSTSTDVTLTLTATDGDGATASDTLTVTVRPPVVSLYRVIDSDLTDTREGGAGTEGGGQLTAWITTHVNVPTITDDGGTASVSGGEAGVSPVVDVAVNLEVEGSEGLTLVSPPTSATIVAGGDDRISFAIKFQGDDDLNADRTVTVTLAAGTGYAIDGTRNSVSFTIQNDDTVPDAPTDLAADVSGTSTELTWKAPLITGFVNDVSAPLTGYEVRHAATSDALPDTWTAIANSGPTTVSHTLTGLTEGTAYTFEVRAKNAVGAGAAASTTATPATFSGDLAGAVTEAGNAADGTVLAGTPVATGTVTVSDSDSNDADTVQAQTDVAGDYGSFGITTAGVWTYTLDNDKDETDALTGGQQETDEFTIQAADGTGTKVVITVTGTNDAASIGGDLTGTVTEDDTDADEASGTVTVTDSDSADTVQAQTDVAGTYGMFSIESDGDWTYALDNTDDDTNALAAGATGDDAFAIAAADGTAGTVTITVTGANDAPTADAGTDATVTEGASVTLDGTDSSDPDAGTTLTYSWARKAGETDNAVTLTNADKASASFTAPNDIASDATLTFVLTVSDGTASDTDEVVITVTGVNAAATIGGDLTGEVTEDDDTKDEASGTVTVTDSDGANTLQAQTDKAGTYGTFSIKANGEWTYTLDNSKTATNALAADATATDEFTIAAADSTTGTVTITVTGANDAPTADAGTDATVTEGASVTLDGTDSSDPDAGTTLTYSWARKAGETDNAVTLTNADKASASFTAPDDIAADATLTFVLTVSDGTASDTDEVVITVTGVNAAATFGGDLTGDVTEDDEDKDEASGTVTVSDSDGADTVQAQTDEAGIYGTFSIKANGEWTYTLDNSKTATNALAADATATDEFTIAAADSTTGTVTITVTGANDAPTADAGTDATVTEGASVTLDGTDSSDPDAGTTLTYSWARKAGETDNAVTLTNADKASASFTAPNDIASDATLTFVLTVSDGTASDTDEVVITVTGVNAEATFGGTLTGAVTEDDDTKNEAEGTVTVSDSDGADTVQAQTDKAGTYGTFSIKTNGEWTYTLDNIDSDTNALAAGATAEDAFAIAAADSTAGTVTVTVTGANDAPTANAGTDTTVAEGASVTLDGTGSSDPDAGTTLTYSWARKAGETDNAVTLTNADKASASFTAPNDIAADATLTFVLTVSDGTASHTDEVVITVTGANAAATIGGDLTGAVTEDDEDKDEASGTVTVTDSDSADTVQAQTDKAGTYGMFSITTAGVWTYTLDNDKDETDALAAGATATDAFAIAAADGTAGTVTITVTGANDAPTADAGLDETVAEGATVTLEGTGTDPDAGHTLTYAWARKSGETDNAVTLTNADKASASFTAPDDIAADATLTFVLTVSDGTASHTDEVVITVTGANAAATIGGDLTGAVTEDDEDKDEASGTVTVTDSDGANTLQAQTDKAGTYGTFSIKANGEWTYTLDNSKTATNALAADATATDEFTIAAADSTTGTVTITVTGANDAPTADAGTDATVTEGASVTLDGTDSSDPDAGTTLTYSWARKAGETDNAVTLTNADKASASFTAPNDIASDATLTFVLTVSDGTASDTDEVVITVTGVNAAATIGGDLTGEVTEDDDTKDEASGTVTVTDSDGANTLQAQTDKAGTYGTFSIKANGEWTYTLDNSKTATNALAADATATDEFTIAAADSTTGTVTITVTGANDAPTADAGTDATVTEGASVTLDGTDSSDPDAGTTLTYSWARKAGETDNAVTLTNADKASASFTAPDDIAADATLTFVLTVSDGTASDTDEVTITVTGANAAATIGGDLTGDVTEDDEDKDEASGTVAVTDSDGANTVQAQTDEAGTYGTFSIESDGDWTYTLDNTDDDTNALAAGATATDAFSITSADGTEGTVTITVTGANDAPTADAGLDATVAEGASVTLDGTGSSDPDAGTTLTYSWARKSGETDNAVTLTNANTASASFTAPNDIAADVTLTFVLTVSDGTASHTDEVIITVTGVNAAATIGGTLTGAVTEDDEDKDEASGTVTITDSDGANTVQAQTDEGGTYGTFSIKANGEWKYELDNSKAATNALAAAATKDDAFPIASADGTEGTVTITVTGANDAPTANAGADATVAEGASVTLDGTGSTDPDASTTLTYAWARKTGETNNAVTLTNANTASASFTAPDDIAADATLTFVLTVSDGTASATDEVVIIVTGVNAAATIGGDLTGAVTEDDEDKDEASGTVTVSDSDGANRVQAQTDKAGTYGTFSITTAGVWTYTLDNDKDETDALAAGATVTDAFAIQSADDTAGTVTITVTGANDAPTANAGADATVAEGASVTLDGTGSSDPDASTTLTYSWARKAGETYNAVTLTNADKASASFTAPDDIVADATLTFVLTVSDGTASDTDEVIITVTGTNAAATFGGTLTGEVTEDDEDKDEAEGTVTVDDSDGADTVQAQTDEAGTYGTFNIKTNGEWKYELDNTDDDTNALTAGTTAEDAFEIAAADGTTGIVTITVTGANDAPTADAGANKTVIEGASVTLDGTGSSDPDASTTLTYSWARKSGETDNAVTLTNADKASASFTAPDDIAANATLTFVLTVTDGTASDTDEVTIIVTGVNAAATIGGDLTGEVTEDDDTKDEATGTVTVTDSDGADTVQAQTDKAGTYGTFSIKTNGEWTYTLDNTDDDTNALAAGATKDDAFAIASADGTAGTITITVTGANDAPTADAGANTTVTEGASVTLDGTGSSDPDASTTLTYSWARKSGETDNAVTLTNADKASASFTAPNDIAANATLTFVLTVSDGTASATDEVVITVTGANAAATFGGDLTGAVTEDDEDKDEASGTVTVDDSDGADTVQAQTDKAGTYGTFSIKTNGEWTYTLDNTDDDTNALAAGATVSDAFAIQSADDTAGTVTITVTGANDAPTADAGANKTVIEGASVTLDGTGSDPDASTTLTYSWARKSGETDNAVTLTNADKASASFTAPDDIVADATLTFVLTVSDGTASDTDEVIITVTGVNAEATFGGDLTGEVTEDDDTKDEASGTVTVTDSDGADTVQAQTGKAGTYGTFSIKTNGEWTYTLDNEDDDTNALAAGATVTDTFSIASADGTEGTVTITVTGANDAPTADAGADKTVTEGASVTLDGTGSSDPDASTTLTYSWARKSGETDNAVTLTNADKASASFTAPDDIAANATLTFVLTVSDGTASDTDEVIITVTGVNAAATFGGDLTGDVTEDDEDKDEASGTVTVTDSDGADTVQAQTDEAGTYGTFSIKTNGEWTYTLDNSKTATNALAAAATATDAFSITSADGTEGTVTITVTGANDAPTADAGANKTVIEGASVTLDGTSSSDPDAEHHAHLFLGAQGGRERQCDDALQCRQGECELHRAGRHRRGRDADLRTDRLGRHGE